MIKIFVETEAEYHKMLKFAKEIARVGIYAKTYESQYNIGYGYIILRD